MNSEMIGAQTITPDARSSGEGRGSSTQRHGRGARTDVSGMRVLDLRGTAEEMGEQHGALLRDDVARGPVPYYRRTVERLLGKPLGRLSGPAARAIQNVVGSRVARTMPDFARDTIRGIARGAGLDEREFMLGCTMPDALMWVTAQLHRVRDPGPAVAHRLALGLGCTSAIAWGNATRDGKLYHARNLDYHGVDPWPTTATVAFHTPDVGQRYVAVTAAGVGLGGITAMNEAGLTLTVHQHMFTDRTRLGGTPIGVVGDLVMREARSLDDAQAILARHKPIGCWTYLVTSGRERAVLCHEENPERRVALRTSPNDTTFAYANIYLDPELGSTEVASYGTYWRHNRGRHARANELVRSGAARGDLDARAMASILADAGSDPRCRLRDSIGMVMTVGSVVFRPEDGALWVGRGPASADEPCAAPTSRGGFVPMSLERGGFDPDKGSFDTRPDGEASTAADRAFDAYRRAYVAYLDHGDLDATLEALLTACELAPEQPVYHAVAGIVHVEAGQAGRARELLDRAIALGHPDEERLASFYLWRGRAKDLAGDRSGARADYRRCLAMHADAPVHAAAKKGDRVAFDRARAARVHIEMGLGDVVVP
ncbi:MAG: C45 family autoproteolytic acyltransferase/hydrolase [Polyangiaceae bacterium]